MLHKTATTPLKSLDCPRGRAGAGKELGVRRTCCCWACKSCTWPCRSRSCCFMASLPSSAKLATLQKTRRHSQAMSCALPDCQLQVYAGRHKRKSCVDILPALPGLGELTINSLSVLSHRAPSRCLLAEVAYPWFIKQVCSPQLHSTSQPCHSSRFRRTTGPAPQALLFVSFQIFLPPQSSPRMLTI